MLTLETLQTEMAKHKAEFVEEQSVRWDKVCIAVLWKKK